MIGIAEPHTASESVSDDLHAAARDAGVDLDGLQVFAEVLNHPWGHIAGPAMCFGMGVMVGIQAERGRVQA